MAHTPVNLDEMSAEEQLDLLERIWDRLSRNPAALPPLSDDLKAELERRSDDLEDDIRAGRPLGEPWSEVEKRLRKK
jgi:putative addiction module component (TIGR02574 family)